MRKLEMVTKMFKYPPLLTSSKKNIKQRHISKQNN